jgi:hypothetical protein
MTAKTGQQEQKSWRQERWVRLALKEQLGKTTRKGQLGQEIVSREA